MKNLFASALLSVLSLSAAVASNARPTGDTIVVKVNDKDKMLLVTDKSGNISSLTKYDLNALVRRVDSTLNQNQNLYEQKTDGSKALKDTSFTIMLGQEKVSRIHIKSYNGNISVNVRDVNKDTTIHVKSHRSRTRSTFDIDLGFNTFSQKTSDKRYDLNPLGSRYISLRWGYRTRIGGKESPLRLNYGMEVAWNNYMFQDDYVIKKGSGSVDFVQKLDADNNPINFKKSKLTTCFLNVPVTFEIKKKNFRVGAGGFVGYRLDSYSKIKYSFEGDTKRDRDHSNFYLNNWQYGLRATVGIKEVDFFVNYHLNNLFESGKADKLNPISFGITF
ncbi:Outer membrane protein beta-barrel domain-containing protein [Flexibacter flexilis DSM 6793]|uniref:Outer membrane protein beta-barrel domain-containing protein n=1 Tax=Flexibacter flexilis DSM 6793 TaxID=927664 RepID=A0A1I1DF19_9BACT|nr:outer membrane beta-barrel protein [Flexibacter flexilis]SFB73511.1 Outer membrane protein beta-barrel domain-containing protein [Flexibacter flexilis DSM 6793]